MRRPSKLVHRAIATPPPERLSLVIEQNAKQAPQRDQTHVGHDGRDEARLDDPRRDEPIVFRSANVSLPDPKPTCNLLGKPISP